MMPAVRRASGRVIGTAAALTIVIIVVAGVLALVVVDILRSPDGQELIDGMESLKLLSTDPDELDDLRDLPEIQFTGWADMREGVKIYMVTRFSTPDDLDAPVYSWCVLQEQRDVGLLRREIVIAQRFGDGETEFPPILNEDAAAFAMTASEIEAAARQQCHFIG